MIKIVTREHWRNLVDERNNAINELNEVKGLVKTYEDTNRELGIKCEEFADKLDTKDKEVRKLKALLTKNKIDYKHLYKGGK
jgi:SMC interacting uncharacterized protein involved in chromosome segregation